MASIKDLKRMCKENNDCDNCPLGAVIKVCIPESLFNNIDEIVDKWVAEHPAKTYAMDFFEKYPDAPKNVDGTPKACWQSVYGNGQYCAYDMCMECWNREMEEV